MGHEVVGVDADPQTRREFQRQYDATTFESLDDLFETEIGAVVITTPNKFHEPTALKAFDAVLSGEHPDQCNARQALLYGSVWRGTRSTANSNT